MWIAFLAGLRNMMEVAIREYATCDTDPAPNTAVLLQWHQAVRKAAAQSALTSVSHDLLQGFVRMLDAVATKVSHHSKAVSALNTRNMQGYESV